MFDIILHQPEIPNNTGNIDRTCIAMGCRLHLIHPLGFDTSEKACRRAGLDYWPRLGVREHANWAAYQRDAARPARTWCFTTRAARPVWEADLRIGDHLLFGRETAGLPDDILDDHAPRWTAFPMRPSERSLNLATAVCAAICEGMRQCAARGDIQVDASGRLILPEA